MQTKKNEQRKKAIQLLKQLDIYKPYIEGFEKENDTCYYEQFGGFWTYQDEELLAKQKEIEKIYNCTVYAITHEFTEFGECYNFLVVTDYPEEWDTLISQQSKTNFFAFAYVWNKTCDDCSEFGTIGIQSFGGGIRRIA